MEIAYQDLLIEISNLKRLNKTIALCHGCFDILHKGHINLFKKAKDAAEITIVGLESDEYIKNKKGSNGPKFNYKKRLENILSLNLVNYIFPIPYHKEYIYKRIYRDIKPNILLTGNDEVLGIKTADASPLGIKIIITERLDSSSNYIK